MVGKTDPGASSTRCRACRKPIIWPGLCYTCATGLPRQLTQRKPPDDEPCDDATETHINRVDLADN